MPTYKPTDFQTAQRDIASARGQYTGLEQDVARARQAVTQAEAQLAALARRGAPPAEQALAAAQKLTLQRALDDKRRLLQTASAGLKDTLAGMQEAFSFEAQVGQLADDTPFLLLPVRVEVRFMRVKHIYRATGAAGERWPSLPDARELWVRIFPDDLAVSSHEESLTEAEATDGRAYWVARYEGRASDEGPRGAWRVLAMGHGEARAAWIARRTQPPEYNATTAHFSAPPTFTAPSLQSAAWTQAPTSFVMPDRFAVILTRGAVRKQFVGNTLPDPLPVGPHPGEAASGFVQDSAGNLVASPELRWMTDFQEAVRVGLALRIPLTGEEATGGFERLLVVGVKLSADKEAGRALVERLLEHHHYTDGGLALVPQGMPTNNTEEGRSGQGGRARDADSAFEAEQLGPLFTWTANADARRDGQWLADALGIDPAVLQHVRNADGTDILEARAANRALWPATLGSFLREHAAPLVSDGDAEATESFFKRWVTGRGLIPAFRVGHQPYGVLPTTAFSAWAYPANDARYTFFQRLFTDVLKVMDRTWADLSKQAQSLGAGSITDLDERFLQVLGLQPSSVEFYQRFMSGPTLLWNLQEFWRAGTGQAANAEVHEPNAAGGGLHALFTSLGFKLPVMPSVLELVGQAEPRQLTGPVVDDGPLSETEGLRPLGGGVNYIRWLATAASEAVRAEDFSSLGSGISPPRALLYLLLRHALLLEYANTAFFLLLDAGLVKAPERAREELTVAPSTTFLPWRNLTLPIEKLTVGKPLNTYLDDILRADNQKAAALREIRDALTTLSQLPTARLERVFAEHLDLCQYRLDAWLQGLVNERLFNQRVQGQTRRTGLHLGAFGWLERVVPGPTPGVHVMEAERKPGVAASSITPTDYLVREQRAPASPAQAFVSLGAPDSVVLRQQPSGLVAPEPGAQPPGQGFLHGPSLAHAVAGAILRDGYQAHLDPSAPEGALAVNLSSPRVRTALFYVEGVRQGQALGALLGYRFERALHERFPGANLSRYLLELRQAFPLVAGRVTRDAGGPVEVTEARNVPDGLKLLEAWRRGTPPWHQGLPGLTQDAAALGQLGQVVASLADEMDAVGDLTLAEAVFQAAQGQFERARAVLDAGAGNGVFPELEFIRTPRRGHVLTQRLLLPLVASGGALAWAGAATPRALAEPALNAWAARLLGDPSRLVIPFTFTAGGSSQPGRITAAVLGLQPLDLLHLLSATPEQLDGGEFAALATHVIRSRELKRDDGTLTLHFGRREGLLPQERTFEEVLPLAELALELLRQGRPLSPGALQLESEAAEAAAGWDLVELRQRVERLVGADGSTGLGELLTQLGVARSSLETPTFASALPGVRARLEEAARFAVRGAIPLRSVGTDAAARDALKEQAGRIRAELQALHARATAALAAVTASLPPVRQVEEFDAIARMLLGPVARLLPRFSAANASELRLARDHHSSGQLLRGCPPFAMEEWLQGVSRVRPVARRWMLLSALAEAAHGREVLPTPRPLQLPHTVDAAGQGDAYWLGAAFPEAYTPPPEALSLVGVFDGTWDPAALQCGLVLDEWVEAIPLRQEVTGVALHHDRPGAEPPQAVLLAVSPTQGGKWSWGALVNAVSETLDAARKRAVDPELLAQTPFAQALPALVALLNGDEGEPTLDFARNLHRVLLGIFKGEPRFAELKADPYLFKK
ncbi:hypothetical protein P2318_17910 [Myxococcaceae bacterium GXIMD 01537]